MVNTLSSFFTGRIRFDFSRSRFFTETKTLEFSTLSSRFFLITESMKRRAMVSNELEAVSLEHLLDWSLVAIVHDFHEDSVAIDKVSMDLNGWERRTIVQLFCFVKPILNDWRDSLKVGPALVQPVAERNSSTVDTIVHSIEKLTSKFPDEKRHFSTLVTLLKFHFFLKSLLL